MSACGVESSLILASVKPAEAGLIFRQQLYFGRECLCEIGARRQAPWQSAIRIEHRPIAAATFAGQCNDVIIPGEWIRRARGQALVPGRHVTAAAENTKYSGVRGF